MREGIVDLEVNKYRVTMYSLNWKAIYKWSFRSLRETPGECERRGENES